MAGIVNWKKVAIQTANPDSSHVFVGVDIVDGLFYIKDDAGVVTKFTTQSNLDSHTANTSNPHSVTKTQVGLSNVPNVDATNRANHTGSQVASTISDFASAVRSTILTGISFVTSTAVVATDSILEAIGKLQAQINNKADKSITITGADGLTGGGDLSANRTITMPNAGTPGTYGTATKVPAITTDAKGRVTGASELDINGVPAINITNTPAGDITATNVQAAINELDNEKEPVISVLPITKGGTNNSDALTSGSALFFNGTKITEDTVNYFWDNVNKRLGIATNSPSEKLDVVGNLRAQHLIGNTATPIVTLGPGAGTGATFSIVGTDTAGRITVNGGTSATPESIIFTLNFASAFSSAPYPSLNHANNTAALGGFSGPVPYTSAISTTQWSVSGAGTGPLNNDTYIWDYQIIA